MHVEDRGDRPHHLVADDRRVDRVDRVADHGPGGDHGDHLVEEGQRVVLEHGAAAGALVQLGDRLLAPLGHAEEEGDHAGAEQQPFGGVGVDGDGAGRHAQDEEPGERHHVDDHDLLEAKAVGHLGDPVADDHQADLPVDGGEGECDRARSPAAARSSSPPARRARRRPAGGSASSGCLRSSSTSTRSLT